MEDHGYQITTALFHQINMEMYSFKVTIVKIQKSYLCNYLQLMMWAIISQFKNVWGFISLLKILPGDKKSSALRMSPRILLNVHELF